MFQTGFTLSVFDKTEDYFWCSKLNIKKLLFTNIAAFIFFKNLKINEK